MRIPTGNFGNVLPQAQSTRVDVGNTGAVGEAMAFLARAGLGVAEDFQKRQEQDNQNALQALSTAGGEQVNKLLYDPETGMTATRKGINAVGATGDALKEWDAWRDKQISKLPPEARERGILLLNGHRIQMERTSFVYEQGERDRALQETYNASNSASVQRESQYYGDKVSTNLETGFRNKGIDEYGKAQGWPQEKIELEKTLWQQKAASGAFDLFVSQQKQSMMGPGGALPTTGTPDLSQLASANMYVESRGQQFRADGSPLVSGAGAVGVAQVMENTGPEAAKYADVEWSRERWLSDPQYNLQIGNAYFEHLGSKYSNNPVLTVAAYNAGQGRVDEWLQKYGDPRKGEISDAGFTAAIPLKETREHVQKVLGVAAGIPPGATIGSISQMPFWNKMSPQDQSSAIDKMSALYDMRASAGRVALQSKMQDDLALLEAGKNVSPITPEAWASSLPVQATPAERIRLEQTFRHYQQAMSLQPVYQSIVQGTPQQGLAAVQALQPQESAPDFKYQQELYATAQGKLTQVLKAREADPGGWLQQNSSETQNAMQQYQAGQTSGEYLASRIQSEKDRFGIISKKVIPQAMVDSILHRIDNSQESSVAVIQSVAQSFGKYADPVMQQVQKSAYPSLQVVMATENPRAANALWQNRNVKTSELRSGFDKTDTDSADSNWNDQAKSFASTMIIQPGGTAVWNNFNEQGKRLTYINMQRGMSASDAAKQAYQDVLGSQYQTNGTWRLPNAAGLDISDVRDGASAYLDGLKPEQITPMLGDPRVPEKVNREQSITRIRDNAQWVTNSDETGLTLMMNGLLVNAADGKAISVPFKELAKIGAGNRSTWNSMTKAIASPFTYTPGQSKNYSAESQRDSLINTFQSGQQSGR